MKDILKENSDIVVVLLLGFALVSMYITMAWVIAGMVLLITFVFGKDMFQCLRVRVVFLICGIITLARGVATIYLVVTFSHTPPPYTGMQDLKEKNKVVYMFTWQEWGLIEAIVFNRWKELKSDNWEYNSKNDPFSGQEIKEGSEYWYSVGPDKEDQSGRVVYDPTNGIFSGGDILVSPRK